MSPVTFSECIYRGEANFNENQYGERADFSGSTFGKEAVFADSVYSTKTVFSYSVFSAATDFSNIVLAGSSPSFKKCVLRWVKSPHAASLSAPRRGCWALATEGAYGGCGEPARWRLR